MVTPNFEGAESICGLGLPQFLDVWPGLGAEPWRPDPSLGQNLAWEGPSRVKNPGPFPIRGPQHLHLWSFGPQTFAI